jgi:protein-S-isoprenylcysteine O-methyltransferase Ste14
LKAFVIGAIAMAILIILPSGTIHYWQGWLFWFVFITATGLITLYLAKVNPELLERRMKVGPAAETRPVQKNIMRYALVGFLALLVYPAIDYNLGLSPIPGIISIIGDVLVVIGFLIVFLVLRVNKFSGGTVEIVPGQTVVSNGPYAIVRHPMYAGGLLLLTGIPLALGSWWGFLVLIPGVFAIISRLRDEDKFLTMNLDGYAAYTGKVHWHLIPMIW